MEITLLPSIVQIRFTVVDTDGVPYTDAVNLTMDEHANLKPGDIEAIAQQRHADWKAFVFEQSNKPTPEPTKEDLQAQLAEIQINEEQLAIVKQELQQKLAEKA